MKYPQGVQSCIMFKMSGVLTNSCLQRLVGLRPYDEGFNDFEPIFIGLDIEADRNERIKAADSPEYEAQIAEVGLAILDSRDLAYHTSTSPRKLIQCSRVCGTAWSDSPSTGAEGGPRIATQVRDKIQIPDSMSCDGRLRNIVIVGHSPQGDLTMLKNLGLDLDQCGMAHEILDTHRLANEIQVLPTGSESGGQKTRWTLEAVMKRMGCTYNRNLLHHGDHDARYHLQAMVMLACQAFDDDKNQATPLPISDGPDSFAPPQQTAEQVRRDLLQEWCRVEFGNDGHISEVQEESASSSMQRMPRKQGRHGRHR